MNTHDNSTRETGMNDAPPADKEQAGKAAAPANESSTTVTAATSPPAATPPPAETSRDQAGPGGGSPAEPPPPAQDGPGKHLKARREAAGLSEMETASRLSISIHQLRALEADDYQNLPAPIFVRNYITRYAELFNLPAEPLLASYQSIADQLQPSLNRVSQREKINSRHVSVRWASYTVIALTLGLVLFWFISVGFSKLWNQIDSEPSEDKQENALPLPKAPAGSDGKP